MSCSCATLNLFFAGIQGLTGGKEENKRGVVNHLLSPFSMLVFQCQ